MNKKIMLVLVTLLGLVLACNLTGPNTNTPNPNQPSQLEPDEPVISPDPVAMHEGLASLNSYIQVMEWKSYGPDPVDTSVIHVETQQNRNQDTKLTHYTFTDFSQGDTEPSTTESYEYSIRGGKCSGTELDGWTYSQPDLQAQEMSDLLRTMTDVVPLIDNPVFVGSENMNGIATNHFTFQVSGLGLESGAEVKANQGDYWLAQDGQYIVKYLLTIETLDILKQTTMRMEILIDLTNINQAVNIAFPQACLDAALVTPQP